MQYIYLFFVFLCLISTSVVSGNLEDGLNFYKSKNFSKAFLLLEPLAINGEAEAQVHLGYMYDLGDGVEMDNLLAVYWYKRAAEQGHIDAQYYLGTMYDLGEGVSEDNDKAVYWYRLAANQGHEWAMKDVRSFDKFYINEFSTISYQTGESGISYPDSDWLKDILNANPNIKNLNLNSIGGNLDEAFRISEIIIEFNLNTKVVGSCFSSCTIIFLAGNKRTLEQGGKFGVHAWSSGSKSATEYSYGHKEHNLYINYYKDIGYSQTEAEEMYFFIINAASADDIHWMTDQEINQYNFITQ